MNQTAIDPEDLFWRQIEERPGDSLPRLVYADWCGENDRPVMADVQRWLVATGRYPAVADGGAWCWVSDFAPFRDLVPRCCLLPRELFVEMLPTLRTPLSTPFDLGYVTPREAERAVERAWPEATKRRWFGRSWRPDFGPVGATNLPLLPVVSDGSSGWLSRQPFWVRLGLFFLFGLALVLWPVVLSCFVLRHLRREWLWQPLSPHFIVVALGLAILCVFYLTVLHAICFEGWKP